MLRRLLLATLIPTTASLAQGRVLQPYVHAGTGVGVGFGALKYVGGRISSFEAGVLLNRRFSLAVERMHIGTGAEAGTWTVGQLRAYPFAVRPFGGFWLSGGLGRVSANARETESAQYHSLYRFHGLGSKLAVGGDLRLRPHLFMTPALSLRRSIGSAESSTCWHPYDSSGQFAPTTCDPWGPGTQQVRAVDLSIALTIR
jgi:hypothetical protein